MSLSMDLKNRKCKPCEGGVLPLGKDAAERMRQNVSDWQISDDGKTLTRQFLMQDFVSAVDFINQIKTVAEQEDHHPDFHLTSYRKLLIELSTHSIGGLSENDFILAAKIDELPKKLKVQIK